MGEIRPIALNIEPYAARTRVVATPMPIQTGMSESRINWSPGPRMDEIRPIIRESAIT